MRARLGPGAVVLVLVLVGVEVEVVGIEGYLWGSVAFGLWASLLASSGLRMRGCGCGCGCGGGGDAFGGFGISAVEEIEEDGSGIIDNCVIKWN